MRSWFLPVVVAGSAAILSGCGRTAQAPAEPAMSPTITIQSTSFPSGGIIREANTGYGQNLSPDLRWSKAPIETKSFAILLEDPDAPQPEPFVHWVVYNIPANVTSTREGQVPSGALQGQNDSGSSAYYGPRPPNGTHHYHLHLYALDSMLSLKGGASKQDLLKAMEGHLLGTGEVVSTYAHQSG